MRRLFNTGFVHNLEDAYLIVVYQNFSIVRSQCCQVLRHSRADTEAQRERAE